MKNRYREEEKDELENSKIEANNSKEVVEDVEEVDFNVEELQTEVKRINDLYLRTLAETENYKKRINEERIRERKYGSQALLEKLVTAMDVFDKAVSFQTDDEKLKNFLIGFEMINNQLKQIVVDEGIKKINALNTLFDPMFHHAVETEDRENTEEGIILEEFQSGYMYKDRVLRPSLVKVNKKNMEEE
jgi:molecular chaperone GrpE